MQSDSYLQFGPFRLKVGAGLWRHDSEVRLPPKEMALLELLVQSGGEVVTHKAIYKALWPRQSIGYHSIARCIYSLRKALSPEGREYIKTVPKRGYQLTVPVDGAVQQNYRSALESSIIEDLELNAQFIHYYDDPRDSTESDTSGSFYAKYRISESDAGTTGYSVFIGTGVNPDYLDQGVVTQAFDSYFSQLTATYGWNNDRVLLDVIPGFTVNLDQGDTGEDAWGFTYASRLAIYDVIPQSAIVAEVFGTTGEAYAPPSYRAGVRWEGKKWVVAATYSDAFDGTGGAGFEIGVIYFTEPRFCFGGCKR